MKRTLFLFFLLFMAVDMTYAQAQKTRIIKCEYFQTDKKGYRTVSYQMEHNERFNVNILNISKPGLSGSVVLTDEALKNVVRMMNEISDLEGTYTSEKLEENDDKLIWGVFFYVEDGKSHSIYDKGKIANMKKTKDASSPKYTLFTKLAQLGSYLDTQLREYQALCKEPTTVFFYDSEGANGLAGILRDKKGKIVDQTTDFAYVDSKEGIKIYSYLWEKIDVFEVDNPEAMRKEVAKAVTMKKYQKPEFEIFVTDAAPPHYCVFMSDGKRMSTSDDNDYQYRPKEMPKQRYDAYGMYDIMKIADKYTHYQDKIKNNGVLRMGKDFFK